MFCTNKNLKIIFLNGFNTQNITDMDNMFNGCSNLYSLDLYNFDTRNVKNMSNMFNGC